MSISLREANLADFESVYEFVCLLQGKEFDKTIMYRLFDDNINNSNNIYLIAADSNKPVGYASCHIQPLLHHAGKVAEIQEVFVLTQYRNQGVGKLLIDEIKCRAKTQGVLQLEVTTRVIREKAIAFYKRESFEDSHKKLVYYYQ